MTTKAKTLRIHITHTDLDAGACEVVFRHAFGASDLLYPVNHDRIDEIVTEVIHGELGILDPYKLAQPSPGKTNEAIEAIQRKHGDIILWITDIAPSPVVMDKLRILYDFGLFTDLYVCDHHKTSAWMKDEKYIGFARWLDGRCGAYLAYDSAVIKGIFPSHVLLKEFVTAVDAYDTWKLDSEYRGRGEDLNKLFKFYDMNRFARLFHQDSTFDRGSEAQGIIEVLDENRKKAIGRSIKSMKRAGAPVLLDKENRKYMYALNDGFALTSELGHTMLKEFEDIDYAVILSSNGVVSMRAREGGVDVGAIAKQHGGGGHAGAAGFKIETRDLFDFLLGLIL
jgi:oligoribonuclease NrnB/cAMP/cGMP phosphodiesterase (DHH superfamily)